MEFLKTYETAEFQYKLTAKNFNDTPKEMLKVSLAAMKEKLGNNFCIVIVPIF